MDAPTWAGRASRGPHRTGRPGTRLFRPLRLRRPHHGSGRTDAGVHALGQVFHVDAPDTHRIPADKWPTALNTRLPRTIRITQAEYVPQAFTPGSARREKPTATASPVRLSSALLTPGLAWHRPLAWSTDILEQAVRLFLGTHDFTAFAALRGNEPRPIPADYFLRTITQAQVVQEGEHVFITLTGTGFLYKMVRLMAGAAHEAARGKSRWTNWRASLTTHARMIKARSAPRRTGSR